MKYSIIIPVYNASNYIERCLVSIKKQTYSNYEVLLIDDGSYDDSLLKARKIIKDDTRFRIISQKNQGAGSARNNGLLNSNGEYVLFVDSDDFLELSTLDRLNKYIDTYKGSIDVICFNIVIEKNRIKHCINLNGGLRGIKNPNKDPEILNISSTACSKLVRKKYLIDNDIYFDEGIRFDDILYTLKLMAFSKRVLFVKEYFYHYVQRSTSLTHANSSLSIIKACENVLAYVKGNKVLEKYQKEIDFTLVNIILFVFLTKENAKNRKSDLQYELVDYVKKNFAKIEENSYFDNKMNQLQLLMNYKFSSYFFRYNLKNYIKYKCGVL